MKKHLCILPILLAPLLFTGCVSGRDPLAILSVDHELGSVTGKTFVIYEPDNASILDLRCSELVVTALESRGMVKTNGLGADYYVWFKGSSAVRRLDSQRPIFLPSGGSTTTYQGRVGNQNFSGTSYTPSTLQYAGTVRDTSYYTSYRASMILGVYVGEKRDKTQQVYEGNCTALVGGPDATDRAVPWCFRHLLRDFPGPRSVRSEFPITQKARENE